MQEVYFSIDIEADGPIPGRNSMLSLGCAAYNKDGYPLGAFYRTIQPLADARPEPDTMDWWNKPENAAAKAEAFKGETDPYTAMDEFDLWVTSVVAPLDARPVCVAYPAGFDFMFVYWYFRAFGIESPFSFSCLDMKSYACAKLGLDYRNTTKKNMPKEWFKGLPKHTHNALDDAIEQGMLFTRMLAHKV